MRTSRGGAPPARFPFLLVLAVAVVGVTAIGLAATARPAREPVLVGLLRSVPDGDHPVLVAELREHGFGPGRRELVLRPDDTDTAVTDAEVARAQLEQLRDDGVDLLLTYSTPHAQLAQEVVPGVPTLFLVNDPVQAGLVTDPRRPDGQFTGVTHRAPADRTLDLTRQVLGGLDHLGYLVPADDPAAAAHRTGVREAAAQLDVRVTEATFRSPDDVVSAVDQLADAGVQAVLLPSSNATYAAFPAIERELDAHGLPAIANTDLASFAAVIVAPDQAEIRRQLARQAARLLDGAPVSQVPVEEPARVDVLLDATRIEELGFPPVPRELLRQADDVR